MTTILTPRLTLRPFEAADAPRLAFLAGDYDVARMCGRVPHPYSVAAAQSWIGGQRKAPARDNFSFAVTARIDGLIGSCGIHRVEDANESTSQASTWEIGYWIGLPYWGLGYAFEAARALMEWAREHLGAKVFVAGHFADNPASGKVLRKLGFAPVGEAELFGLARQQVAKGTRYVWPEGAAGASLACSHRPH